MNYKEGIDFLRNKDNFYIDLGLNRISSALEKLGNPQNSLKYIHVAGTNGKGSVCAMLDSVLTEAGYKTGLYTSPHIWEYTERIKVCGKDISQKDFANYIELIRNTGIHLTEFEILTVIAFLYFKDKNTDIVILETGLGGRLDATNVIKENICSIITHIALDHTDRLGSTKEKIAFEKAGIIKENCPIVTSMKYRAIKNKAASMKAPLILTPPSVPKNFTAALSLKGVHQKENLALVITVLRNFFGDIPEETIINGLSKVKHPCRFEFFSDKNLIVDASHNPNGIKALKDNLDKYFPDKKRRFVFGCLKTKDCITMMKTLFKKDDEIFLNGFDYPCAYTFKELNQMCPFPARQFLSKDVLKKDRLNIICGSFYMISGLFEKQDLYN